MDLWQKARSFAEEAAKQSQALTRSTKISDIVSETAKRSKEIAAEASKKADQIKIAALKQADHLKSLAEGLDINSSPAPTTHSSSELQTFGVTDDLRDFVKGLTLTAFRDFPIQDEPQTSDVPTVSNIRQDLTEWQEKHATLVLTTVKEISKLRYELCPRHMKERQFWRIYFTLVSTHVAPYEKQYVEAAKLKVAEQIEDDKAKQMEVVGETYKSEVMEKSLKSKTSTSSSAEQDLDTFLLGDLEDSDGGLDDHDGTFDDDFDKIDNSDVEDEKQLKTTAAATS